MQEEGDRRGVRCIPGRGNSVFQGPEVCKGRCERGVWGLGEWGALLWGRRPWKSWQDGLAWGQRPGLPHSGMWALASRQVKEWKGD